MFKSLTKVSSISFLCLALVFSSCNKEDEPEPSKQVNRNGTSGSVYLWSKSYSNIKVYIQGSLKGTVNKIEAIPVCGTRPDGAIKVDLPAGTYEVQASSSSGKWEGKVTVRLGRCDFLEFR